MTQRRLNPDEAAQVSSAPDVSLTTDKWMKEPDDIAFRVSRATLIGLGLSLVLHVCLLLIAAVITTGGGGWGGRSLVAAPVEVALVDETPLTSLNEGPTTLDTPGVEDVKGSVDLAPMPVIEVAGGSGLSDIGEIGGSVGTGLGGAGTGTGIGIGTGSGGTGAGGTSFFGQEARGSRFAFIVDISGSMEGEKLDTLKRELIKSLDRLTESSSFVVLCFESDVRPLGGNGRLIPAQSKNKKSAIDAINLLRAEGGTQPSNAFRVALRSRPRPDAIYFMTDGEQFPPGTLEELATLNGQFKVPVHCIRFGDGDIDAGAQNGAEQVMRTIAKQSKGTYKFISIK